MNALALALVLASVPADAPVADVVVTQTAVLETTGHTFVARGRGVWLSEATAIARAHELASLRQRLATQEPTWLAVVAVVLDAAVKVAGVLVAARWCSMLCR